MVNKKVLVVGGGLGGLSAAISLAAEGYQVEIYEKNDHLGGKLNQSSKEGFTFDLGPSILTMPHIFSRLFDQHNRDMEDYLEITRLDLEWRNFFADGTVIDLYAELDDMLANNEVITEKDITEVNNYLDYAGNITATVEEGYFAEGLDTMTDVLKFYGPIKAMKDLDFFNTMASAVSKRISNSYLQHIYNFFIKYVGSSPYKAPAVLNLLPYIQYRYGLWYVPGGMYNIAKALQKLIAEVGIKVRTNSEVTGMLKKHDRITGIKLADGEEVEGDIIVANMEVIPTYRELLQEKNLGKMEDKFEPACSGYVLHLGVDREYPNLAHHNFFFSEDPQKHFATVFKDYQLPEDPTIYLVATSRTDDRQAPEGCENIKILPHIPHLGKGGFSRQEYDNLKERVLSKLERMGLTDLRKHIIVEDEWLPEDIAEKYYSNHGAIYGVVSDRKKNHGFKAPKKSTRYDNLYFVGGSVNPGGGMPMVVLSGQQVKDKIVGES